MNNNNKNELLHRLFRINEKLVAENNTIIGRLFSLFPSPYYKAYKKLFEDVVELSEVKGAAAKPQLKIFNPEN